MVTTEVEPVAADAHRRPIPFVAGVAVPLVFVTLVYTLWWISDRLLYIGPFDRAAFGWAVVIPLWVAAPVATGFVWHRLAPASDILAAIVVGATISGAAAFLFWQAVAYPQCETAAARTPGDWVVPSLILGTAIGGGLAFTGLLVSGLARSGRPWRAVLVGAGTEVVMVFAAILVAGVVLLGPGCLRPTV